MKSKFLLTLTCCLLFSTAKGQISEIQSGVSTGLIIDQITNSLNSIISRAEAAGDFVLKRSSQEVLYVLDAFEKSSERILDRTFDNIGRERRSILNQIIETTNQLERTVGLSLFEAEQMLNQINILVRDVTFKKYPVIFRYRGGIIAPGQTQNIRLSISGANLTRLDRPKLVFRGKEYLAKKLGETAFFEIPRDLFVAEEDNIFSENAKVYIRHEYGGFLGLFERKKITSYDLNLVTLPKNLGQVSLKYKSKKTIPMEKVYEGEKNHNSSSRDWDCRSFAFSPSASDRRINPDKSYVIESSGNKRGKLQDISIRDVGISFRICARRKITDKGNGFRHAKYKYVEEWTEYEYEDKEDVGNLNWTEDVVFYAGQDSKDIIVQLKIFDGQKRILSKSGSASKYIDVSFDEDQKIVIIKPRIPQDILRL